MLINGEYGTAFSGETVLVRGYWELSKRKRKKLSDHLNFEEEWRPTFSAKWMLTCFVPAPLIAIHPAWLTLSGIAFLGTFMGSAIFAGETKPTNRPRPPRIETIAIGDDARWKALEKAFAYNEWRNFKKAFSSDTELCQSLSGIVFPYMDETNAIVKNQDRATELGDAEGVKLLSERLKDAAHATKHEISKKLGEKDRLEQERKARADAEAEEIRQGELRVLRGDIQMILDSTSKYEELARQAELEQ